jgi:hypothetical protein
MYILTHTNNQSYDVVVEFEKTKKEVNRYFKSLLAKPERAFLNGTPYSDDRVDFSTTPTKTQNLICNQNMQGNMYHYASVVNNDTKDAIWWEAEPVDEKLHTDNLTNVYYVFRVSTKDLHTDIFQFQDVKAMIENVLEQKKLAIKKFGEDAEEKTADNSVLTNIVRNKKTGEEIWWNLYGFPAKAW